MGVLRVHEHMDNDIIISSSRSQHEKHFGQEEIKKCIK